MNEQKRKKTKLVEGHGVNDFDGLVTFKEYDEEDGKLKSMQCDVYVMWKMMLRQCFSSKAIETKKNRSKMTVCDEWLSFSNFREWAVSQNAFERSSKGNRLKRKESIVFSTTIFDRSNKLFSPNTCLFTSNALNRFMQPTSINGLPIGVYVDKRASTDDKTVFTACVYNPVEARVMEIDDFKSEYYRKLMIENFGAGQKKPSSDRERKPKRLGLFNSAVDAHLAWKAERHQYALQLADIESKRNDCDERIVKALKERFRHDSEWLLGLS